MKYAFFIGCNIPARVHEYEDSSRAVLKGLGVELVDMRRFNCCGYPMRNIDMRAFVFSAARNLAVAEDAGLDMLVMCKCCFGSLKKAEHLMKEDGDLLEDVNRVLAGEGLKYEGRTRVRHLLSVLAHDVGTDTLTSRISRSCEGLGITVHYGCHALRPSRITEFDDPVDPHLFEELVEITGAECVTWPGRLECCGAPLMGVNDTLSIELTEKKLAGARKAGAQYLCTACPFCHLQFETVQTMTARDKGDKKNPIPILYTQLLAFAMERGRNNFPR